MKRSLRKALAGALVVSGLTVANSALALNGPVYPAPGGNLFSGSGASAGDAGGRTNNYSGFDTSAFDELYWGPDDTSLPAAGLDGTLHTLTFDSTSGTTSYWDTTSSYFNPTTGLTSTQTIWLAVDVTGLGATPWVTSGSVGLPPSVGAVVDDSSGSNFSANLAFTVGASPGGTPINSLQQSGTFPCPSESSCGTQTSFSGAFYYTDAVTVPEPAPLALIGAGMIGLVALRRVRVPKGPGFGAFSAT